MRLTRSNGLLAALVAAAILAAALLIRNQADDSTAAPAPPLSAHTGLEVFDAACALVDAHYFDRAFVESQLWKDYKQSWRERAKAVDPALLYVNVLDNFVRAFPDSHLHFQPPRKPEAVSTQAPTGFDVTKARSLIESGPGYEAASLRRGGITQMTVADVRPDSPAARAGISPGWIIESTTINADARGVRFLARVLPLDAAGVRQLDATALPPGVRSWEEREVYLKAHAIEIEFDLEPLPTRTDFEQRDIDGIVYLRFDRFDVTGASARAMDALDRVGAAGLILDLRHNTGGSGIALATVLGRLLGNQTLIGHTHQASGRAQPMKALSMGSAYQGPLIVLIGPATASAAEVAAAAIQDHGRGRLLGRRTSGSAVGGQSYDLPDGGRIMIPVSNFVRGDGSRIEGVGVEPDLWLLPSLQDAREGRDPLLVQAVALLRARRN